MQKQRSSGGNQSWPGEKVSHSESRSRFRTCRRLRESCSDRVCPFQQFVLGSGSNDNRVYCISWRSLRHSNSILKTVISSFSSTLFREEVHFHQVYPCVDLCPSTFPADLQLTIITAMLKSWSGPRPQSVYSGIDGRSRPRHSVRSRTKNP